KALALRRQALGEAHPDTTESYAKVAGSWAAQGKYAEAEASWRAAAGSFEAARLAVGGRGPERAAFAASRSPLLGLTACLAHNGKRGEAWQALEPHLARGLLGDLASLADRAASPEQRRRLEELRGRLRQANQQVHAHLGRKDALEAGWERFQELTRQRDAAVADLAQLDAELSRAQVFSLERIQAQVPPDAALVAWLDRPGEHWACVLRRAGPPAWVRLPGSGPGKAW